MDISTIALLALAIVTCVLNLIVLSKLGLISKQLATPIVKKLAPEIKLKNVKRQPKNEGPSKQRNQRKPKDGSDKGEKGGKGRNNRNQSRNRNRNKPAPEVFSNDVNESEEKTDVQNNELSHSSANKQQEAPAKQVQAQESTPATEPKKTEAAQAPKRESAPQSSNRPTLAPRGEAEGSVESKPVETAEKEPVVEAEKTIRHGRRAQVKR